MQHYITLGGERLPVVIRKRRGAKRMVLRYQPASHALSLTLPRHVSHARGLAFAQDKAGWIRQQVGMRPARIPFADGQIISVLGKEYLLAHVGGRGVVRVENDTIPVPGQKEFMARRVREWLIRQAREEISLLANAKAKHLGRRIRSIALRDTRSLWGSCNAAGRLSFSWRLILAPPEILDYVVSHEAAHLAELNHSRKFWSIVAELCPNWREHRAWLKKNGDRLYAYG